jgi:MoaA/NifB/PqqE/SkfB family radical SAM enzyme
MNNFPHLYINPLEKCNLRCKICYTRKTTPILTEDQILDFVKRYQKVCEIQTITFCGGEVFTLPYFTDLVNVLTDQGIFVQVITNASINRIIKIQNPNSVNIIVSIDGLKEYHDSNRGDGRFDQCITFLKDAKMRGFHTEVFSIVTKQNFQQISQFEAYMYTQFPNIPIAYHPRKPISYVSNHPISNIIGRMKGFDFLDSNELVQLMKTKKTFPPKDLGCYQISLASDGKVYGCCESYNPIGTISTPINRLIEVLKKRVDSTCFGCVQPSFMCGIKDIIRKLQ